MMGVIWQVAQRKALAFLVFVVGISNVGVALTWSTPANVSGVQFIIGEPVVAMNTSGNAVSAWTEFNGTNQIIKISRFNGTTWTSPLQISTGGIDSFTPSLAFNSAGNALVTWQTFDGTNYQVVASYFNGTTWGAVTAISATNAVIFGNVNVTLNTLNLGIATWVNPYTPGSCRLQLAGFIGTWLPVLTLATDAAFNASRLALSDTGLGIALWYAAGTTNLAQTCTYNIATQILGSVLSLGPTQQINSASVAINSLGVGYAAWSRSNGSHYIIEAASFVAGLWGAATTISDTSNDGFNPVIKYNTNGKAVATWEGINSFTNLWEIRTAYFNGLGWSGEAVISDGLTSCRYPTVTLDGNNIANYVWTSLDDANSVIKARYSNDFSFGSIDTISATGLSFSRPVVSHGTSSSRAVALWFRLDSSLNSQVEATYTTYPVM